MGDALKRENYEVEDDGFVIARRETLRFTVWPTKNGKVSLHITPSGDVGRSFQLPANMAAHLGRLLMNAAIAEGYVNG